MVTFLMSGPASVHNQVNVANSSSIECWRAEHDTPSLFRFESHLSISCTLTPPIPGVDEHYVRSGLYRRHKTKTKQTGRGKRYSKSGSRISNDPLLFVPSPFNVLFAYYPLFQAIRKKIESELARKRTISTTGGVRKGRKAQVTKGTVAALKPSPALTVPETISVSDASQLCAAKRTDCVLVVDEEEGLCGIFTAKDLAYRVR